MTTIDAWASIHEPGASRSTHFTSYCLRRMAEDSLLNQHRAAGLQKISVRIVSSPFSNCLAYCDLEVANLSGLERANEGRVVGKISLGNDYDIVVHEVRPKLAPHLGTCDRPRRLFEAYVT